MWPNSKSLMENLILCTKWWLSANREILHLHGKLSGFVKSTSKSRHLKNLLTLKNLVDKGGASL